MGWRDIQYDVVAVEDARLSAVVQAVQATHVNGRALLRVFRPTDAAAFDVAAQTDLQGVDHWLRCFLESPSVRAAVPELRMPDALPQLPKHTWYGGFEFEGAITHLLLSGGAYERPAFGEDVARRMSRDFVDALSGDRQHTSVWRIDESWTDWFYDVAWDRTFVVQQLQARRWGLLCVTDTD